MRLRDLGGLIVVDFIDMDESKNRREVEQRLRDALRQDRARVQFSSISKFGLLELSRQRLRPSLSEGSHITCPRCNGTGHIRDTESSALQILRMVQEESMKDNTAAVHVQVPVEVTSFLLNEKRKEITMIELKQRVNVILVPNKHLDTPNYKLERLRHDDPTAREFAGQLHDDRRARRRSQRDPPSRCQRTQEPARAGDQRHLARHRRARVGAQARRACRSCRGDLGATHTGPGGARDRTDRRALGHRCESRRRLLRLGASHVRRPDRTRRCAIGTRAAHGADRRCRPTESRG